MHRHGVRKRGARRQRVRTDILFVRRVIDAAGVGRPIVVMMAIVLMMVWRRNSAGADTRTKHDGQAPFGVAQRHESGGNQRPVDQRRQEYERDQREA